MGGNASKVFVQLHKPYYYTGDAVHGDVYVHIVQPLDVKALSLKVTGVEKCSWEEDHGKTKTTYHGKHIIFKTALQLMGPQQLQPGSYQVPFSFQVPQGVPGSFSFRHGGWNNARASIVYKAKAKLDVAGFFSADLKHSQQLPVLECAAAKPLPIQEQLEQPVSLCCCFSKGSVHMEAKCGANSYLPGETLDVSVQVDNRSTTHVSRVMASIVQTVHLEASSLFGSRHKRCSNTKILGKMAILSGDNGRPGSQTMYHTALQLPRDIEATCLGRIVKSSYELKLEAATGCCITSAALKSPFTIWDAPPAEVPQLLTAPPGWSPQVLDAVELTLPPIPGWDSESLGTPSAASAAAHITLASTTHEAADSGKGWGNSGEQS